MKKCLVIGGGGALGRTLIETLNELSDIETTNLDFIANPSAKKNIILSSSELSNLIEARDKASEDGPYDAIICVAGGWQGDTPQTLLESMHFMWQASVSSCTLASTIPITSDGILILTSAMASLKPSPGMIGYGMSKAAVNHLVISLGKDPKYIGSVVGILPQMLDTPGNRKYASPTEDFSTWTPLQTIAERISEWVKDPSSRPTNGSLISILTTNNQTSFTPI